MAGSVGIAPAVGVSRRRLGTRAGLRIGLAASVVALIVMGVVVSVGVFGRQAALQHAVTSSEPLAVAAESIYQDMSDADDAAAEIFLAAGQGSGAAQARFNADLAQVSAGLAQVGGDVGGSAQLRAASGELAADLPTFTRLIGTAEADARQNLPVGAAYLREASALLRDRLLPAARSALAVESGRLTSDDSRADGGAELYAVGAAFVVLVVVQVFLWRRTRRVLNGALVTATVLVVGIGVWVAAAGSAQGDAVSRAGAQWTAADSSIAADLVAVQAHGDELLGLAARGEDGGAYEQDFGTTSARLTSLLAAVGGSGAADARQGQQSWLRDHAALLPAETQPQPDNSANVRALQLLTEPAAGGSDAAFGRVDADLRYDADAGESGYLVSARAGHDDLAGLAAGAAVLAVVAVAAAAFGMDRRLRDYR